MIFCSAWGAQGETTPVFDSLPPAEQTEPDSDPVVEEFVRQLSESINPVIEDREISLMDFLKKQKKFLNADPKA